MISREDVRRFIKRKIRNKSVPNKIISGIRHKAVVYRRCGIDERVLPEVDVKALSGQLFQHFAMMRESLAPDIRAGIAPRLPARLKPENIARKSQRTELRGGFQHLILAELTAQR